MTALTACEVASRLNLCYLPNLATLGYLPNLAIPSTSAGGTDVATLTACEVASQLTLCDLPNLVTCGHLPNMVTPKGNVGGTEMATLAVPKVAPQSISRDLPNLATQEHLPSLASLPNLGVSSHPVDATSHRPSSTTITSDLPNKVTLEHLPNLVTSKCIEPTRNGASSPAFLKVCPDSTHARPPDCIPDLPNLEYPADRPDSVNHMDYKRHGMPQNDDPTVPACAENGSGMMRHLPKLEATDDLNDNLPNLVTGPRPPAKAPKSDTIECAGARGTAPNTDVITPSHMPILEADAELPNLETADSLLNVASHIDAERHRVPPRNGSTVAAHASSGNAAMRPMPNLVTAGNLPNLASSLRSDTLGEVLSNHTGKVKNQTTHDAHGNTRGPSMNTAGVCPSVGLAKQPHMLCELQAQQEHSHTSIGGSFDLCKTPRSRGAATVFDGPPHPDEPPLAGVLEPTAGCDMQCVRDAAPNPLSFGHSHGHGHSSGHGTTSQREQRDRDDHFATMHTIPACDNTQCAIGVSGGYEGVWTSL